MVVGSPADCPNVPNAMKIVASAFDAFVKTSELKVYDMGNHQGTTSHHPIPFNMTQTLSYFMIYPTWLILIFSGVWRNLMCRYSKRTKQLVLMLCVQLTGIDDSVWRAELHRLCEVLQEIRRNESTDDESAMRRMIDEHLNKANGIADDSLFDHISSNSGMFCLLVVLLFYLFMSHYVVTEQLV